MLIKKLELQCDSDMMLSELNNLLIETPWPTKNQLGLKYRDGASNVWVDAVGSLYDRVNNVHIGREIDFTNWCVDQTYFVRQEVEKLEKALNIKTGRVRFMKLPSKQGLTIHRDSEMRYHLVLKTNPNAHFGFRVSERTTDESELPVNGYTYHVPKDNHWYVADTKELHWVFNGGMEDRIHLVVSEI